MGGWVGVGWGEKWSVSGHFCCTLKRETWRSLVTTVEESECRFACKYNEAAQTHALLSLRVWLPVRRLQGMSNWTLARVGCVVVVEGCKRRRVHVVTSATHRFCILTSRASSSTVHDRCKE